MIRKDAIRLTIGRHVIDEIMVKNGFWWHLCQGARSETKDKVRQIICDEIIKFEPPQLDNLTDEMLSGWINEIKARALIKLYEGFAPSREVTQ